MKANSFLNPIYNLLFVSILLCPLLLNSQNSHESSLQYIIDSTKKIYGSSELLVNGPLYFQPKSEANGSPFLYDGEFIDGSVYTGETEFKNSILNYDISTQKLLLLITTSSDARRIISLSDVLIDSFMFSQQLFVNPDKIGLQSNYSYLHSINNGCYSMYIGYSKDFINRYNNINPYGKYSSTKRSIFVLYEGSLIQINSKKTFLNLFPSMRKDVSTFLRKNKIKFAKASATQLSLLMEFINERHNKRQ